MIFDGVIYLVVVFVLIAIVVLQTLTLAVLERLVEQLMGFGRVNFFGWSVFN
jgi:hypothetical protein